MRTAEARERCKAGLSLRCPFQRPKRVVGTFGSYAQTRQGEPLLDPASSNTNGPMH